MLWGTQLLATAHPPYGRAVLAFGSVFLGISILEIVLNKRRFASAIDRIGTWVGRLFAITVWLLMVVAGIKFLAE